MLLTIITINLNNASGLHRTIESVIPVLSDQVEYLVLDGVSSDGSQQVLAEAVARDARVQSVVEPDKGIYDAMNKGWRRARGRYVAYLNSGDELIPAAYLKYIDYLALQSADVCYAKTIIRSEDGSQERIHEKHPQDFKRSTVPHPTAAVLRAVLEECGGFDEQYRICADRELFIRLKLAGSSFQFFDEVTTIFYEGGASSSRQTRLEDMLINVRYKHISKGRYWVKRALFSLQKGARKALTRGGG
jgi:glycosyltransferase involved in cell wall biosynthesis